MIPLTLKYLFSSKLRIKLLAYFFFHPGLALHVRRLAREVQESAGTVARELRRLEKAGLLASEPVGNQKHYSLRKDSPILDDLRNLFLKTAGASAELRAALEKIAGIELAFLYGSYPSGDAHASSDLDLMVIGEVSDRELAPAVARIERRLKRPINYTLFTRREVEKKAGKKGEFLHEVLSGSKIVLIGKADDRLLRVG
jgi:predicted nucleotidyltransferase